MVTKVAQDVLDAAVECLAAGSLRVDDVARRAGCNKRMIYHYYGNKAGVVAAARASQAELLAGSRLISADTRGALRDLFPQLEVSAATVSHGRLQRAARIILLWLLEANGDANVGVLTPARWQSFVLELTTLALRGAPLQEPGKLDMGADSEDSLTRKEPENNAVRKKPSFRLASVSRPRRS